MPSPREKLRLIGLGIVAGMLFGGLSLEAYVRIVGPTIDVSPENALEYTATLFSRHNFPHRQKTVDSTGVGALASYSLNEKGFRGEPFATEKPEGQVRIFVLGGSSVFDIYASRGNSWPQLMDDFLGGAGHEDVRVVNGGVPGHASWDALGRLYSELWLYEPDYVLLYACWNDLKYLTWVSPDSSLLRGFRPKPMRDGSHTVRNPFIYPQNAIDGALASISQAYVRIRNRYISWRLGPIGLEGPVEGARGTEAGTSITESGREQLRMNVGLFVDAVREVGAVPVLVAQSRLVDGRNTDQERTRIDYDAVGVGHEELVQAFDICDRTLAEVGSRENVPVIRATRFMNGKGDAFRDHVHTNRTGSLALARLVGSSLLPILR